MARNAATSAAVVVSNDAKKPRNARVSSFVHTLDITRPENGGDWLEQVGKATEAHRTQKARSLDAEGAKRERATRLDGGSDEAAKHAGAWFRSRAKGQRRRIEAVRECRKEKAVVIVCNGCGTVREKPGRCGCGLLCTSCRGKRAAKKRGTFREARNVLLGRGRDLGLLRHDRKGGRWSEKLLTLTAPHVRDVELDVRVEMIRAAWPHFLKAFNTWLRGREAAAHSAWFRNLEWEQSTDGKGHPHIHAYLFCPFLDRETLKDWWRNALQLAGYSDRELRTLIIDIREAKGRDVALEIIKYLTKDLASDGSKVKPETYAQVVCVFDGARTTQASRGFMGLAEFAPQCDCGACGMFTIRIVDLLAVLDSQGRPKPSARAPP